MRTRSGVGLIIALMLVGCTGPSDGETQATRPSSSPDYAAIQEIHAGMGRCSVIVAVRAGYKPDPRRRPQLRMEDVGYSYSDDEVEIVVRMSEPIPDDPPQPARALRWEIALVPPAVAARIEVTKARLRTRGVEASVDGRRLRVNLEPTDSFPGPEVVYTEVDTEARRQRVSC